MKYGLPILIAATILGMALTRPALAAQLDEIDPIDEGYAGVGASGSQDGAQGAHQGGNCTACANGGNCARLGRLGARGDCCGRCGRCGGMLGRDGSCGRCGAFGGRGILGKHGGHGCRLCGKQSSSQGTNGPYGCWHNGYAYTPWGVPAALVVPPTAAFQTNWGWGVGNTRTSPICPQFGPNWPGQIETVGVASRYLATPPQPSDTTQFGVNYVRGPW
jgi:hypothetical protein